VEIANQVKSARLLGSGNPVKFEQRSDGRLFLRDLPTPADPICTTIALDLDGPPRAIKQQKNFWIPG